MKIALVEDEKQWVDTIAEYINRFNSETGESISIEHYSDGKSFIENYKFCFDIVFMDIAMPNMNGLEAARRLREMDDNVCLIFITTLAKYAIKGYEVKALDFLVKPIEYDLFKLKLERAIKTIDVSPKKTYVIKVASGKIRIDLNDILYIESVEHYLYFHTFTETYKVRGKMTDLGDFFHQNNFVDIGRSILVNLKHVTSYSATEVRINKEILPISRVYKKGFIEALTIYLGGAI